MNLGDRKSVIVIAAIVTNVDIAGWRPNPAAVPVICIIIVWPAPPQAEAKANAGTKEGKASAKTVMDKPTVDNATVDNATAHKTAVSKSGVSSEATDAARMKSAHSPSAETAHSPSVETA